MPGIQGPDPEANRQKSTHASHSAAKFAVSSFGQNRPMNEPAARGWRLGLVGRTEDCVLGGADGDLYA